MSSADKIRIAVIFGGRSNEHGISVVSAGSVLRALDPERFDVVGIGITPEGKWVLSGDDPEKLAISGRALPEVSDGVSVTLPGDPTAAGLILAQPGQALAVLEHVDVVFPVLHGRFGEDGTIQGLLEMAGIAYVGSGVFASAAGMDKEFSKKLLAAAGLAVGRYVVVHRRDLDEYGDVHGELGEKVRDLGLPLFVKPSRAGSSVGITKVSEFALLPQALALAFEHDCKVLIEAAVVGREIECGVLEDADGVAQASVPAEIRMTGSHDWYDFEAKYLDDACEFDVPAVLSATQTEEVQRMAVRAFEALDCAGLARVDFFLSEDGPVVNEINTMPGFTSTSMFPRMWAASGVSYPQVVSRLVAAALRR